VLVTGSVRPAVAASGFQLVHAAIRLRKPVIVVDLAAGGELAGSLAAVCTATGAPLQEFGAAGTGYYEPFATATRHAWRHWSWACSTGTGHPTPPGWAPRPA
jgi:hypothetical protein